MHVLLIHQSYAAAGEAGGTRHHEIGQRLVRAGHRVTVIASCSSYLSGSRVGGGRGRLVRVEDVDGLRVVRTPAFFASGTSFVARVAAFVSFLPFAFAAAMRTRGVDVVVGTSPPLFQAPVAAMVATLKLVPFVLEIRDLWPSFAVEAGVVRNRSLIACATCVERWMYRRADRIVINSPGFREHIVAGGADAETLDLVPNGADTDEFHPDRDGSRFRREHGLEGKFVALYAGAHGAANDLGTVLDAARLLSAHEDLTIVLVGDGREKPSLVARAEAEGLRNVVFVSPQPKRVMPEVLAAGDVCVALLKPWPLFRTVYPNKVFDYLAAGKPVVLAIDGVIREAVESAAAGTFAEPGDPQAISRAIDRYRRDRSLANEHGANGRRLAETRFRRDEQAHFFEEALVRATGLRRPDAPDRAPSRPSSDNTAPVPREPIVETRRQ